MVAAFYDAPRVPIIDVSLLESAPRWRLHAARQIDWACSEFGFFYIVHHGIDAALSGRLLDLAREFFSWNLERKLKIHMSLAGRAWRGYFPVGEELTAGVPDIKEGIYFGSELPASDVRVAAGVPLHGPNLFPDLPGFRETVMEYMAAVSTLAQRILDGIAIALDQEERFFEDRYTHDPTVLLRIFSYPTTSPAESSWGVGEHTDYGLLTLLKQDSSGLQIKYGSTWLDVPEVADSFVVNVGDVLECLTRGRYRSAPHRARNLGAARRISVPLFFDPSFDARLEGIPGLRATPRHGERVLRATYGEYLLSKVSRVFPDLGRVLG